MAKYTGPKHRLARREGSNIIEKTSMSLSRRLNIPPGVHGPKGHGRKASEFKLQLREKQKAKVAYGLLEKQFRKYYEKAAGVRGKTGEALFQFLESRLDNVVYRLGFVPSRSLARQLVSHGHVLVNGKTTNIPSYSVKLNDLITLSPKALNIPAVKKALEVENPNILAYFERKAAAGRMVKLPSREEVPTEVNEQLIIEYYSR